MIPACGRGPLNRSAIAVAFFSVLGALLAAAEDKSAAPPASGKPTAVAAPHDDKSSSTKQYDDVIRPLLVRHCLECHGIEKPKGDLRLDRLSPDFADKSSRETWEAVRERIARGEMPPKGKPRPPEDDVKSVSDWIGRKVRVAEADQRASEGRVILRRLNRVEYENTVRDLLGIYIELQAILPRDSSSNGFDNVGEALHLSSFQMEKYLEAAERALNLAITNRPKPPPVIKQRYFLKNQHVFKLSTESVYRPLDDDALVLFSSSPWNAVSLSEFYPRNGGNFRFRVSASGFQSAEKPVTYRLDAGNLSMTGKPGLVGYFDAPADKPNVVEFTTHLEPTNTMRIHPYALAGAQTVHKIGADKYDGPGLAVQWVEVEGPVNEVWPPESHHGIFGDLEQAKDRADNYGERVHVVSKAPPADAEQILRKFARRAFRRAVSDDDMQPFLSLVEARLNANYTFEQAVRVGLQAILVSPEFLFLNEKPGKLDDFALASRLSYFLWSTMPDEELLALAEDSSRHAPRAAATDGTRSVPATLQDRETLRAQVERMLDSPKAAAFTENFVGQWLGLRDIDFTEPSHQLHPEFDDMLKVSMVRETELFFAELLKNDLSLLNFVDSDFTMLNGRLAKHYGIPGVEGWEFHKTPLPPGSHRGGVMTMASVLKVTANGTSTSPVTRGAWVLDRILGTPPPRPPENVAALEPDIRGATTIREQLAKHRQIATCAACHARIDPAGFALESFDVIGGWRENYRVSGWFRGAEEVTLDGRKMPYLKGLKVDPADVLADGRAFANIDELKRLLLTDKDQIARGLTIKLVTYATGGPPATADLPQIDAIVARVRERNYGFRSLIHEIVQSELFRMK
jgi:mono/diheme cytochrome c family protein